jgi:hypothetical protein
MKNENFQTLTANNQAVIMNGEREKWSMWDPAIPADLYRQYMRN